MWQRESSPDADEERFMQSPGLVHRVLPILAWSQIVNSPIRSRVMNGRILMGGAIAVALASLAAVGFSGSPQVEVTDFATAPRGTQPVYDARLAPVSSVPVKEFRIPIRDATVEIAKGVTYKSWTFGGTVPGPVIRVREGDLVRIRLGNEASMPHSVDFHAARIPMNKAFRTILPQDSP